MPAKKPTSSAPADKLEAYEKLIATHPEIERKGATMPYTSHNGHMFSVLHPDGTLALRLPKAELEAFLKKHKTMLMVSYGTVQKEWAKIPDTLLKDTKELKKYLDISYEYVKTLKPKATSKAKK